MNDIERLTQVRVLHMTYSVTFVDYCDLPDQEEWGHCDLHRNRIIICRDASNQSLVDTLWHEIKHAINHEMGLHDKSTEEEFVLRGTKGELAVLRDNPTLREILWDFCSDKPKLPLD